MDKTKLKSLSIEELRKKEKSLKLLIGIFIPIILGLLFFVIRDYVIDEEFNWAILTIVICTIGGPVSVYPELKAVREELSLRN